MMAVRNFCGTGNLKFDDALGVFLSEEAHRKSLGLAETSRSALNIEKRGRPMNRKKKKNDRSKSKSERGNSKSKGTGC